MSVAAEAEHGQFEDVEQHSQLAPDEIPEENGASSVETQRDQLFDLKSAFTFHNSYENDEDYGGNEQYDDYDAEFDELETELLGEDYSANRQLQTSNSTQYASKVNLSKSAQNDIVRSEKTLEKKRTHTGKDDRATVEQVLDPRTRLILFKYLSTGFLDCIDGCLSTGKEANVYYARGSNGAEYAVKIYKTSILVFKDRDKYVSGDYRLRRGYSKSNPRKMVRTWAEKEFRNLKRIQAAGIPAPQPVQLKSHVLLMDFLGKNGWPSPRLKDAELSSEQFIRCYQETCMHMRTMYLVAKLVHGDLSEYNMLWHDDRVWVIDVSQSVEHEHPFATEFLRKDCRNVNDFFARNGVQCLSMIQLFRFVTDADLPSEPDLLNVKFQELLQLQEEEDNNGISEAAQIEEAVFMQSYIPRTLMEFSNPHVEHALIAGGGREKAYATAIEKMLAGNMDLDNDDVVMSRSKPKASPNTEREEIKRSDSDEHGEADSNEDEDEESGGEDVSDSENEDEDDDDDYDEDDDDSDEETGERRRRSKAIDPETKERMKQERKQAKKQTKQDQAEKRKTKLKKHLKKQKVKRTARRK